MSLLLAAGGVPTVALVAKGRFYNRARSTSTNSLIIASHSAAKCRSRALESNALILRAKLKAVSKERSIVSPLIPLSSKLRATTREKALASNSIVLRTKLKAVCKDRVNTSSGVALSARLKAVFKERAVQSDIIILRGKIKTDFDGRINFQTNTLITLQCRMALKSKGKTALSSSLQLWGWSRGWAGIYCNTLLFQGLVSTVSNPNPPSTPPNLTTMQTTTERSFPTGADKPVKSDYSAYGHKANQRVGKMFVSGSSNAHRLGSPPKRRK